MKEKKKMSRSEKRKREPSPESGVALKRKNPKLLLLCRMFAVSMPPPLHSAPPRPPSLTAKTTPPPSILAAGVAAEKKNQEERDGQKKKEEKNAEKKEEKRPPGQMVKQGHFWSTSQIHGGNFGKSTKMKGKRPNCPWPQLLRTPIKAQFKAQLPKPNPNWAPLLFTSPIRIGPPKYPKPTLFMHPPHPRTVSISSAVTSIILWLSCPPEPDNKCSFSRTQ
jgi:hypothetical protein